MSAFQFMEVAADCAAHRKMDCVFARDVMGDWHCIIRLKDNSGIFEANVSEVSAEKDVDNGLDAKGRKKTKTVKLTDDEYYAAVNKAMLRETARAREARIKSRTSISPMIKAA